MTADILSKTISPFSGLLGKDQKQHRHGDSQQAHASEYVENWEMKPSDALREEILSSSIPVSERELERIFNNYSSRNDDLCESVETETSPVLREAKSVSAAHTELQKPEIVVPSITPATEKSLGVFSDSRIYSAMIRHELKRHHVTIKHFHHPDSFRAERFDFFDSIDAWMVFLSDTYEGDFLEEFLERYAERPTLFLFEKSQRRRTVRNIEQFLADNKLAEV